MPTSSYGYAITDHGDLVFRCVSETMSTDTTPLSWDERFAILFDRESGTVYKHGAHTKLDAHRAEMVAKLAPLDPEMAADLVVFSIPAVLLRNAAVREVINHCLNCSGYVLRLQKALEPIFAALPEAERVEAERRLAYHG